MTPADQGMSLHARVQLRRHPSCKPSMGSHAFVERVARERLAGGVSLWLLGMMALKGSRLPCSHFQRGSQRLVLQFRRTHLGRYQLRSRLGVHRSQRGRRLGRLWFRWQLYHHLNHLHSSLQSLLNSLHVYQLQRKGRRHHEILPDVSRSVLEHVTTDLSP